jgi:hypothetical protein
MKRETDRTRPPDGAIPFSKVRAKTVHSPDIGKKPSSCVSCDGELFTGGV